MLRIIVTSGPTNERIDSVMKITNMSTGTLGRIIAMELLYGERCNEVEKLYYLSTKMSAKPIPNGCPQDERLELVTVESTDDLLRELTHILTTDKIDAVIHSAAVGDYKAKYSVRAEDLVQEILSIPPCEMTQERLLEIFDNPKCAADDSGKMSSYEPHLMTMMTLTPKVIGHIKEVAPDTKLIGFKLLDGVTNEQLFNVASKLREKNNADFIVANDLSRIGGGKHWAMIIGKDGIVAECETKMEIAAKISQLIS